MKIISKHHDYYDACLAYGHDDHIVYLRDHLKFEHRLLDRDVPEIIRNLRAVFKSLSSGQETSVDWMSTRWYDRLPNSLRGKNHMVDIRTIRILFCGKHYPAIRAHVTPYGVMHPSKTEFFYDADSLIAFLEEYGVGDSRKSKWSKDTDFANIRTWFNTNTARQPDYNWMVANKVTCVVADGGDILVNPPLKDYQFFRKLDPYTAFQELDMYVGGTLAYPQNMMVEIEDKYRIMAHGFDMKYGFRTRPKNAAN